MRGRQRVCRRREQVRVRREQKRRWTELTGLDELVVLEPGLDASLESKLNDISSTPLGLVQRASDECAALVSSGLR